MRETFQEIPWAAPPNVSAGTPEQTTPQTTFPQKRADALAIRRALKIRDSGCRYAGCCQTKYVDAHHIHHWCAGGETSLENLVLLCRHHHRLLHEGGFSIEKASNSTAALKSRDRRGEVIEPALYPQFRTDVDGGNGEIGLERDNTRLGLVIDTRTTVTRWQGERMDYGMAMDALMRNC